MPDMSPRELAKALVAAVARRDRPMAEQLIAPEFRFSSPYDNGIDRAAWFATCWPGTARIAGFDLLRLIEDGETVVVTYVGRTVDGTSFRNTEVLTCRGGRIVKVEVYFGWSLPHPVPPGEHAGAG